jgi:hypothetical protein
MTWIDGSAPQWLTSGAKSNTRMGFLARGPDAAARDLLLTTIRMGNLCGKSSAYSGGHTVLGSSEGQPAGGPASARPSDPRAAAAEAAQRRQAEVRASPLLFPHFAPLPLNLSFAQLFRSA